MAKVQRRPRRACRDFAGKGEKATFDEAGSRWWGLAKGNFRGLRRPLGELGFSRLGLTVTTGPYQCRDPTSEQLFP